VLVVVLILENPDFHNQYKGKKCLRDYRALFAADHAPIEGEEEDEQERPNFGMDFLKA